jgi:hypothetical protein
MKNRAVKGGADALLAFGRRVSPGDAFDKLTAGEGWQSEAWTPTFVEPSAREEALVPARSGPWQMESPPVPARQVLRRSAAADGALPRPAVDGESRMMVTAAPELPSLYFVQWHYIDFVLSCVGNISEASRVLGIRRSTLQRKRKKNPPAR